MPRTPNIILIMADQMRPDALGPATPNLLRLAERGTRFTCAYTASPLCQPARVSLITGMYPSQTGVCGNMNAPVRDALRDDTFMNHLRSAGYTTAMIGKHHYTDHFGEPMDLTDEDDEIARYGFDHVWQVADFMKSGDLRTDCRYSHHLRERGLLEAYRAHLDSRGEAPFPEEEYVDAYIGRCGREFVEQVAIDRPFYLNLSFMGPHPPYSHPGPPLHDPDSMVPPVGAPDSPRIRSLRAAYMGKVTLIDRYVGALVQALDQRGLLESTVILFTSDHGDDLGDFGRVGKRFFREQIAGIPLLMCGPGVPRFDRDVRGKWSPALVSHVDLYPTLLGIAGQEPATQRERDGRNILAILRDERGQRRDQVVAELGTAVMVRTGNWKLVFDPEQGGVQDLYNLATDPRELTNLAGVPGYERTVAELLERLLSHRIRLTQFTHDKEKQRLQRVRI